MKTGKYFTIPEGPTDLDALWHAAAPIARHDIPPWLTPETADTYRMVACSAVVKQLGAGRSTYLAELDELEAVGCVVDRDGRRVYLPEPTQGQHWSIGLYAGDSPFHFWPAEGVKNPIITRDAVSDVTATFVADPFMIKDDHTWYMFFEVMNWRANKGEIGLALSNDGIHWYYQQIVLREEFHLSYPYVFQWQQHYYMIPESFQDNSVRLYQATRFPTEWRFVTNLLEGHFFVDASVVYYQGRWCLFAESNAAGVNDTLRLFLADQLTGPWREHPCSPIIAGDPRAARPAGRVLVHEGAVIRYAQNCLPAYGTEVRAFVVSELTPNSYQEREVQAQPVLGPGGAGWNACGMHHLDAHALSNGQWLACVDGWRD